MPIDQGSYKILILDAERYIVANREHLDRAVAMPAGAQVGGAAVKQSSVLVKIFTEWLFLRLKLSW